MKQENTLKVLFNIGIIGVVIVLGIMSIWLANSAYKTYHISRSLKGTIPYELTMENRLKELDCLARNIYYEAGHESFEGKVAVAQVTLNRVKSGKFANSVCAVVYQKNVVYQKVVCQFSWYCNSPSSLKVINKDVYKESENVAKKVLFENFRINSLEQAIYYHADYVSPGWKKQSITKIGRHIFYKE